MKTTLDCFRMGSLQRALTGMLGLLALLGMGMVVPSAAHGVTPVLASELEQVPTAAGVNIEERLEPQADGSIAGDFTFTGNANEVIVIYLESAYRYPFPQTLQLYGPAGEAMPLSHNYPDMLDFKESEGFHLTLLLPETGSYRLVLADDARDSGGESLDLSYLLRVRKADYYERLMMAAEVRLDQDNYEAALGLFAQAIEDSPERPGAYLSRVFTYAGLLYETSEFNARFDELASEEDISSLFSLIYETFTTLEPEEQSFLLSDLRQLEQLYSAAIANGEADEEFDPAMLGGLVEFLQTGVPTDAIRLLFFGTSESVEPVAPVIIPAEPEVMPDETQLIPAE